MAPESMRPDIDYFKIAFSSHWLLNKYNKRSFVVSAFAVLKAVFNESVFMEKE